MAQFKTQSFTFFAPRTVIFHTKSLFAIELSGKIVSLRGKYKKS